MNDPHTRVQTGIKGLDHVLQGGLPSGELYLLKGGPGTGKTTLSLQFLIEGAKAGEPVLYITLSQTEAVLHMMAESHRWSLDGIEVRAVAAASPGERAAVEQTVFHAAEVELGETVDAMIEAVRQLQPTRVVFDSVAELRLLAESPLRYRRQIVTLRQFLAGAGCTVMFLDDESGTSDGALEGLAAGVIRLEQGIPTYGELRRRLQVVKIRGAAFRGGHHDFRILTGGLEVFPRLVPTEEEEHTRWNVLSSGVAELDHLLGGGLDEGTATVLMGPAGTGKSSVTTLYAREAARRGEHSALFLFDERLETYFRRSAGLGLDIRSYVEEGLIDIEVISTGEVSAGEFAHRVRTKVEERNTKIVVIDTLTGYLNAMAQEEVLLTQMHDVLSYLSGRGVLSLLVVAQHGVVGSGVSGPIDMSYLADTVLLLRHFEAQGGLRKAISVIKKRSGDHEKTIRELRMAANGIRIGNPIVEFSGILTGTPVFHGSERKLMAPARPDRDDDAL